jgi:hypothetical protein
LIYAQTKGWWKQHLANAEGVKSSGVFRIWQGSKKENVKHLFRHVITRNKSRKSSCYVYNINYFFMDQSVGVLISKSATLIIFMVKL